MNKLNSIVATATILPIMAFSGSALAGSPGQLGGGSIYQVRNVTQNTKYADASSTVCNDTVEYSLALSNTGYGTLTNINVAATLPSAGGTSTATATTDQGSGTGNHGSVSVTVPTGDTMSLVDGTTKLYSASGTVLETLPDTITGSGVNAGTLNGSTVEYVNFEAKVTCPTTTVTPPPTTTTTTPPTTTTTTSTPTTLVNTGPGSVIAIFAAVTAASAGFYHFVLSRRLARR
jgi:hypothetical protein